MVTNVDKELSCFLPIVKHLFVIVRFFVPMISLLFLFFAVVFGAVLSRKAIIKSRKGMVFYAQTQKHT